ncbi:MULTISPECIES: DUF2474 family protein [Pacificibacter]|nr:DUF2474 family protein [Pacificibacter marinus]
MLPITVKRIGWFIGLWVVSVLILAVIAFAIRLAIGS